MDTSLILMIVLGLLVLFYFVVLFFSARTWQILHVLLLFAIFLAAGFFCVFTAAVLKTHQGWRAKYNQVKADLEKELADHQLLREGNLEGLEFAEDSLRGTEGALQRALVDRGRIWRNLTPTGFDDASQAVTLSTVGWTNDMCRRVGVEDPGEPVPAAVEEVPAEGEGEQEAGEGAAAGTAHGIEQDAILYAFKEVPISLLGEALHGAPFPDSDLYLKDTQGLCRVPMHYLGEFKVAAATNTTLNLEPSIPLDQSQVEQIRSRDNSWVLFETLPLDAHEVFAGLDEQALRVLFPPDQLGLSPDRYERLISEYSRDQQAANQNDPPERKWLRVEFKQAHKVDVDVEGAAAQADRAFDPSGRAVLARLQQGSPTEFAVGDVAVLDGETARKLIGEGVCEKVGEVFVRELRDYDFLFRQVARRYDDLQDQLAVVSRDIDTTSSSNTKALEQVQYRTQEKGKLVADLANFQSERDLVSGYLAELQKQENDLRNQLRGLYHANNQLLAELTNLQKQVVQKVRRSQARADGVERSTQ